jgi:DNA polymerase III subunit chi
MTRVDFHFNADNRLQHCCRLIRKIYRAGQKVVVFDDDAAQLARLNQTLWTFSPLDFIPHVMASAKDASQTPVLLASEPVEFPHHDVLVNLSTSPPEFFSRFERLIEVVGTDDGDREQARGRWRFYKERGYPIATHDLTAAK